MKLVDGHCFHDGRGIDLALSENLIFAAKGGQRGKTKYISNTVAYLAPKGGDPSPVNFLCGCGANIWCPKCNSGVSSRCGCIA